MFGLLEIIPFICTSAGQLKVISPPPKSRHLVLGGVGAGMGGPVEPRLLGPLRAVRALLPWAGVWHPSQVPEGSQQADAWKAA